MLRVRKPLKFLFAFRTNLILCPNHFYAVDAKAMDGLPATVVNAGAVPTTLTAMD
jgi:hypothetical protein